MSGLKNVQLRDYDHAFAKIEQNLNMLGYIPIISTATGAFRVALGAIEALGGEIGFWFRGLQYLMTRNPETREFAAANQWSVVHGEMNIDRGAIEMTPIIGNLTTFVYDKIIGLRANRAYEKLPANVDPIFDDSKAVAFRV